VINTFMKVDNILETDDDIAEWKATKELCTGSKPDTAIGSSALSSCKAQGYRARKTKKTQKIGKTRKRVDGKKKSEKYGGPVSPTKTG